MIVLLKRPRRIWSFGDKLIVSLAIFCASTSRLVFLNKNSGDLPLRQPWHLRDSL